MVNSDSDSDRKFVQTVRKRPRNPLENPILESLPNHAVSVGDREDLLFFIFDLIDREQESGAIVTYAKLTGIYGYEDEDAADSKEEALFTVPVTADIDLPDILLDDILGRDDVDRVAVGDELP